MHAQFMAICYTARMADPKAPEQRGGQEQEIWYERTRYQILLFAVGIALFVLVLGLILDWYINPQGSTQKKDLVQALGLITAGVAGAVGIFFTWRGQRLAREAQEENQRNTQEQLRLSRQSKEENQRNTQEQLRLSRQSQEENQRNALSELTVQREGQITERFTRAIDQLGSESLETRLGGIYALERIARDSERDHWSIMEVLTAYVRHNSPRESMGDQSKEATGEESEEPSTLQPSYERAAVLNADIQAIVIVLRRRTRYLGAGEPEPINLRHTHLEGARLRGTHLEGARLKEAHLEGAYLERAHLEGARLRGTHLERARLKEAHLEGARLRKAHLERAHLEGARLKEAHLEGARLKEAHLEGAHLEGAHLEGAHLGDARDLTQEQLEAAIGDEETKIPDHLERPLSWLV